MKAPAIPLALALVLCACASGPGLRDYGLRTDSVELTDVPFFPQTENQCGPAALATLLAASGLVLTPEELTPRVYLPEREGSLQAELVAATRHYGRVPYLLRPNLKDLLTEVAAGTPVLVLQNLGLSFLPQWHYAVVVGYDASTESLLLRSGTEKRQRLSLRRFESSWSRAQGWALVAVSPEQIPVTADSNAWLRAASAFEELKQPTRAAAAYSAATRRWPEQSLVWQTLANARYTLRDLPGSEIALRRSLELSASAAAHNNLAHVLLERGCFKAAAVEIQRAEAMPDAKALADTLIQTRAAIEATTRKQSRDCPL